MKPPKIPCLALKQDKRNLIETHIFVLFSTPYLIQKMLLTEKSFDY